MPPLRSDGAHIYAGALRIETIDPQRAAEALFASGMRWRVARAIASGALRSSADARALARQVGLITTIDAREAREKGLVQ